MVRNKVNLAKNFNIQPSEIDKMDVWEYELFVEEVNNYIKEESKEREKQEQKYDKQYKMPKASDYKTPSMSSYKLPK